MTDSLLCGFNVELDIVFEVLNEMKMRKVL